MKNNILFILLIIGTFSYSQTLIKTGDFYNSTDIKTNGSVIIKVNKKGKTIIEIKQGFSTEEGPDLGIYLSKDEKVLDSNAVFVDNLYSISGFQQYKISKEIDVSEYNYIVIHCTQYNHWYGSAKLQE